MRHPNQQQTIDHPLLSQQVSKQCLYQYQIVLLNHPLRNEAEKFIATQFKKIHNAEINSFMPQLLVITDLNGDIKATLGIRHAEQENLFLEHYFEQPIERILKRANDSNHDDIARKKIVEVGNLASIDRLATRKLFTLLTQYLVNHKFNWIVFTGCESLRYILKKMHLNLMSLGNACQSKLPSSLGNWGHYYKKNAQVLAGNLIQIHQLTKPHDTFMPQGEIS